MGQNDDGRQHFFDGPGDFELAVLGMSLRVDETYCLEGHEWLHDNLIQFYLEYLRRVKFAERKDDIEIVGPAVTQLVKMVDDPDILKALNLLEKMLVLIPLNDAKLANDEGTHWSLIVMTPNKENVSFYHLDSMGDMNKDAAMRIVQRFCRSLNVCKPYLWHYDKKHQENAFDCGLFVMCNAEKAMQHFLSHTGKEGFQPATQADIVGMRGRVLKMIKAVAKDQAKDSPSSA